jgi:hypothetical protein
MVIASITLASIFSAYAFYMGNNVQNEFMQNVNDAKRKFNLQLEVVYATIDNSTDPPHFVVYVKNIGYLPLNDFTYLDVYAGSYGKAQLYTYNLNAQVGSGQFNLTDANENGVWEPRETATIRVYPKSTMEDVMFEVKIVPSGGIGSSYFFSSP